MNGNYEVNHFFSVETTLPNFFLAAAAVYTDMDSSTIPSHEGGAHLSCNAADQAVGGESRKLSPQQQQNESNKKQRIANHNDQVTSNSPSAPAAADDDILSDTSSLSDEDVPNEEPPPNEEEIIEEPEEPKSIGKTTKISLQLNNYDNTFTTHCTTYLSPDYYWLSESHCQRKQS